MNKPLTIEELKALEVGDWVWVIIYGDGRLKSELSDYVKITGHTKEGLKIYHHTLRDCLLPCDAYGTKWLAYKTRSKQRARARLWNCRV